MGDSAVARPTHTRRAHTHTQQVHKINQKENKAAIAQRERTKQTSQTRGVFTFTVLARSSVWYYLAAIIRYWPTADSVRIAYRCRDGFIFISYFGPRLYSSTWDSGQTFQGKMRDLFRFPFFPRDERHLIKVDR